MLTPFQAEESAHHRVAPFRLNGILVPEEAQEIVPVIGLRSAAQEVPHVLDAVERAPGFKIELLPRPVF